MTERRVFHLVHATARQRAIDCVKEAPDGWRVDVRPATRSLDQNALLHGLCEDLARSSIEWFGKRRNAAEWKVLMVSGHAVATKQGGEAVTGIEGEFVSLRESTATMSKSRGASLIEYIKAFCAMNSVDTSHFSDQ